MPEISKVHKAIYRDNGLAFSKLENDNVVSLEEKRN